MNENIQKGKILIVAGEASGDHHAADLVKAIKKNNPQLDFIGVGGDAMRAAGVDLLYHISQLAFLGFAEIIKHLPFILKVLKTIKTELQQDTRAIILVDYPGLNLRIARIAKKMKVPVIYYISPQLWAWREKRIAKIRRFVDLLLVIFRFEVEFYKKHNITAHFSGHPMVDQIRIQQTESEFRKANNLPTDKPILGIFPGSREMEVKNLLPVLLESAAKIRREFDCLPVIGCAPQLSESLYDKLRENYPGIPAIRSQTHQLMHFSHCAMVASGTATLELGYLQTPMVVLYSVSPLTYRLGKMLIKINNIAMVNIVLGKTVVPELIQENITVENIVSEIGRYFAEPGYHNIIVAELGAIKTVLGDRGASQRAADKITAFLNDI